MNNIIILCFLTIFITTIHTNTCLEENNGQCTLYPPDGVLQIIDGDNFEKKVTNSSRATLLQLYLHWCSHCQKFAPAWKDFSRNVYSWRDLVQVAVIDCADERNTGVCAGQNVSKFPAFKYLPVKDDGIVMEIPEDHNNFTILMHDLLDRIISEIKEGRDDHYPDLLLYKKPDVDGLFDGVPKDTKYVFVVIEKPGVYLGAEVIMDLHKVPNVVIKRTLVRKTGLFHRYTVLAVDYKGKMHVIPGEHKSRKGLRKRIITFLQTKGIEVVVENAPADNGTSPNCTSSNKLRKYLKKMGDVNFQKDLEAALRYSLKQEVSITKTITETKLNALVSFVKVLKKYFPFGYKTSDLLWELTNITSGDSVDGNNIKKWVNTMEEMSMFSTKQGFLGCLGSTSQTRGYPCSLWKLFHYLTVNADNNPENPGEILQMISKYIENFFTCEVCTKNFQNITLENKINDVSSLDQSILWLWKAHNEVNKQLAGDVSEDPEYPKIQFPSISACPTCIDSNSTWNEKEVLKYLKNMYSKYEVRYLGADTTILIEGLN